MDGHRWRVAPEDSTRRRRIQNRAQRAPIKPSFEGRWREAPEDRVARRATTPALGLARLDSPPPSTESNTKKPPKPDGSHHKIHALITKNDKTKNRECAFTHLFQSSPSAGRATKSPFPSSGATVISIHALHVEGDIKPPFLSYPVVISILALIAEGDKNRIRRRKNY